MDRSSAAPLPVTESRRVEHLVRGQATSDGDGVKLTRVLTQPMQRRLDPFLMLDEFGSDEASDYIGGFPTHPHRGFETVTYMLAGRMRHQDSVGNVGLLGPGSLQWMTAGRGILHSEMPEQEEGRMAGFQLWVNLPAAEKMTAPQYQDVPTEGVPSYTLPDGVTVRVLAGESRGVAGAVQRPHTEPLYLDIHLPPGSRFSQTIPASHNAFLYVYEGELDVGGNPVPAQRMAILSNSPQADGVQLRALPHTGSRVLLVAGRPLGEPIVQYGPFVMNTESEIRQALIDMQSGRLAS